MGIRKWGRRNSQGFQRYIWFPSNGSKNLGARMAHRIPRAPQLKTVGAHREQTRFRETENNHFRAAGSLGDSDSHPLSMPMRGSEWGGKSTIFIGPKRAPARQYRRIRSRSRPMARRNRTRSTHMERKITRCNSTPYEGERTQK